LIFKDMYGTDQLANQKTHEFFNLFSSQITDMPASAQQELIRLWANNFNLHSASQISDLMTSRGYHGMVTNQTDITNLLAGFKSGAIDLNTLPAWRTKETACNVLFCNTQGEQLTDLIFDKVSLLPPVGPGPGPIPPLPPGPGPIPPVGPGPGPIPPGPRGPRYDNFLSFGAPTVRNEVNKFNNNEPAPAATNNDTDE
jgi:hypothetical protein